MTPQEQAEASLAEHIDRERALDLSYKKVFSTPDGKRVLADLMENFPFERLRYDAPSTRSNPLASMIGAMHFDGSAAVTKHISDHIKAGEAKPTPAPRVTS